MENSLEGIEKISQIIKSNQDKLNNLHINNLHDSLNEGKNFAEINQFLIGLDIDIKNILSLLNRIKNNFNSNNMNGNIIFCGCCECGKNCFNNQNEPFRKSDYLTFNVNNGTCNNLDYNLLIQPNQTYSFQNKNFEVDNICNQYLMDKNDDFQLNKRFGYIIRKPFIKRKSWSKGAKSDNKIQNSIITKSKRFSKNKYKKIDLSKKNNDKENKYELFLYKLYDQKKDVIERFKKVYGDNVIEKLMNGEIDDELFNEMKNILNKLIEMYIWRNRINNEENSSNEERRRIKLRYNPVRAKKQLIQDLKDKQCYYKEYPRGWNSTKEYFINNGTSINNDKLNLP